MKVRVLLPGAAVAAFGFGLAALWAWARSGSFAHELQFTLMTIGIALLVLGILLSAPRGAIPVWTVSSTARDSEPLPVAGPLRVCAVGATMIALAIFVIR